MKTRKDPARARRALYAPAVLVAAAATHDARAATADSVEFRTPGSSVPTYTFNVVANNLVTGSARPLQLVRPETTEPNHKHGVSGYIEYQRLESYELIDFQDVSVGLRFQRSF